MTIKEILEKLPVVNDRNYWLVRTNAGNYYNSFLSGLFIAIGYDKISLEDISLAYKERPTAVNVLSEKISTIYGEDEKRPKHAARQLIKFVYSIKKGDIVMIPSENSEDIAFIEVVETPVFNEFDSKFDCPYIKRKQIKHTDMSLEEKVMAGMKDAMKAKDEALLRGLRAIKAAILLAKTSGGSGELTSDDEVKLLQKLVKQRKDSLDIYRQQNRADLAQKEEEEIAIIEKFLPKQLDAEELKTIIAAIIAETGASSVADMGKVMGAANKQLAGQADGKTISAVVKELLSK